MELLDLTQKIKALFGVDMANLGDALMKCVLNAETAKYDAFVDLVDGDLTIDWLQKVYQYYLADRDMKKQDFTPVNLAKLLAAFVEEDDVVDLCAGSGALTIQAWAMNPDRNFKLLEADDAVVPFLLFNLAVRNIAATVCVCDALANDVRKTYVVRKGARYGTVSRL